MTTTPLSPWIQDLATVAGGVDRQTIRRRRGSLLPCRAFEEIAHNAHAASAARFVRLVLDANRPMPEMNACVATRLGVKVIDALWRDLGKGVEIDGRSCHVDPRSWAGDLARQNAVQLAGVLLLRIAAERLWSDPAGVVKELGICGLQR